MIYSESGKEIKVMLTVFRDGLQSLFGGKVRVDDVIPAMECAAHIGINHMEFGGGARFQAPLFYVGEDPFECMKKMRETVGPDVILQILTRSVSGVTLTNQSIEGLQLQAKLMKEYGTSWDRNFDFMNDVGNMIKTGQPIVDSGMHHQACVALMGLPFKSDKAHTPEFYIDVAKRLLESDVQIDSICMKDASGTTDPTTVYKTAIGIKKLMPPEMPLWFHTHDTASTAVACNMAAIEGGADGIDLALRPMASGTSQPDVRSMAHALKGTGYKLDIDHLKVPEVEAILEESMSEYEYNPVVLSADARVVGFPMPGGAIGPNVHMMKKAGILHKYSDVLAEFPVVVEAGGAWTSVTPGSQQYWLQAFNNVLLGRWKKIDAGFGKSVLGYFGKTPLDPDPEIVKIASEQLELPPFDGDPLEAATNNIPAAQDALKERNIEVNDKNTFLVLSSMVQGKDMNLNEGIKLLTGNPKIDLPLKKKKEYSKPAAKRAAVSSAAPQSTVCTVEENGVARTFKVTFGEVSANGSAPAAPAVQAAPVVSGAVKDVFAPFDGTVPVTAIKTKIGDVVTKGQVLAIVEALKAQHDVKSPVDGTVANIFVIVGAEVESGEPILSIAHKG